MDIQAIVPKSRSREFSALMIENPIVTVKGVKVGELQDKYELDMPDFVMQQLPFWVTVL